MMGRAKGTLRDQTRIRVEYPGNGMDLGCLQRLFQAERGEYRRQPLGQHSLARSRRTDHEDVVATGSRNLQSALGGLLPTNIFEVEHKTMLLIEEMTRVHMKRLGMDAAI